MQIYWERATVFETFLEGLCTHRDLRVSEGWCSVGKRSSRSFLLLEEPGLNQPADCWGEAGDGVVSGPFGRAVGEAVMKVSPQSDVRLPLSLGILFLSRLFFFTVTVLETRLGLAGHPGECSSLTQTPPLLHGERKGALYPAFFPLDSGTLPPMS